MARQQSNVRPRAMSRTKNRPPSISEVHALTIEQLELGLRVLDRSDTDLNHFWDRNIDAFRRTVLLAIRETSDALLSSATPMHWRAELESELEELVCYFELAERYRTQRLSPEWQIPELPPFGPRLH